MKILVLASIEIRRAVFVSMLLLIGSMSTVVRANTLIWDPIGATSGLMDGAGTWTATTGTNWNNGTAGNPWSNSTGDMAQFGNASSTSGYTVTVSGSINVGGIIFDEPNADGKGYTVQGTSATVTGTLNGPSGGTFYISAPNAPFFTQNTINNINFTGASTYQFDSSTTVLGGGWGMASDSFSGNVVVGNGTDSGEVYWYPTDTITSGTLIVNSGTFGGGWSMYAANQSGTYNMPMQLNSMGTRSGGGLWTTGENLTWNGAITLGADASITYGNGPGYLYVFNGAISGNHNLWAGVSGADAAGQTSEMFLTNTNNNYTGATLIGNIGGSDAVGGVAEEPLGIGANNALPVSTIVIMGIYYLDQPYPGISSYRTLTNGQTTNNPNSDSAFDLHGFNQSVTGLAVAQGATAASQLIGNWVNGATSILTITGTTSNGSYQGGFGGTITDGFGMGTGKVALVLSGTGAGGAGTLAALNLTGANSYSGGTVVNSGVLTGATQSFGIGSLTINPTGTTGTAAYDAATVTSTGAIFFNAAVTVNSNPGIEPTDIGTLNLGGTAASIGSLAGNGNVVLSATNGTTASIGFNNASTTFSGVISQSSTAGGITKVGTGTLILTGSNTYTGATTVNGGTLQTTVAAGAPYSSGAVALNGGVLGFAPSTSGSVVALNIANAAAGTQLTYGGGATLALNLGANTSLTVTAGNTSPSGQVLVRSGNGTLVIAPANGTGAANLGASGAGESFKLTTAPAVTSGIVNPSIVGQNNDGNLSGDFLNYTASGFVLASYGDTNFNSASSSLTEDVTLGQTLTSATSVYALRTSANINAGGNTLTIGNGAGQAGLILDGATISNGTLAFGGAEGVVYSSLANGSISTPITGSGGLTAFGPGALTLGGSNTGLTGGLNLNQGIVSVSADSNLGASSNGINFNGGTLQFAAGLGFNPASTHAIKMNASGGTIDTNGNTITESGTITGAGPLSVASTTAGGVLIMTASNTYSGITTINGGVLQLLSPV